MAPTPTTAGSHGIAAGNVLCVHTHLAPRQHLHVGRQGRREGGASAWLGCRHGRVRHGDRCHSNGPATLLFGVCRAEQGNSTRVRAPRCTASQGAACRGGQPAAPPLLCARTVQTISAEHAPLSCFETVGTPLNSAHGRSTVFMVFKRPSRAGCPRDEIERRRTRHGCGRVLCLVPVPAPHHGTRSHPHARRVRGFGCRRAVSTVLVAVAPEVLNGVAIPRAGAPTRRPRSDRHIAHPCHSPDKHAA